jgi:hypothetical protein
VKWNSSQICTVIMYAVADWGEIPIWAAMEATCAGFEGANQM